MCKFLSLLSTILLLSATIILAQPNSEVRLIMNEPADCINNIMYLDIEVRAASIEDTFRVSGQNYRFSFDGDLVGDPKIETELELSGVVTDGTNTVSFYNTHTLVGSLDTIVSYNVEHSGPVGYLITTDWLSIGRVSFDLLTDAGCFNFPVHIAPVFPSTSVSAITPNGLVPTNITGQDLSACIEDICTVPTAEIYEEANWSIFPNPVNDQAYLQLERTNFEGEVVKVEVMDVSGKRIYTEILSDNSFSTASLLPGIYLVQLRTDNWQSGVQKLVKLK